MEIESFNSLRQNAQLLLALPPKNYRLAVHENHVTLFFDCHVVVRIEDDELVKLVREFERLDQLPAWFPNAVMRVLSKRHRKKRATTELVKAARLYSSDPAMSKLLDKITADFAAAELLGT